MDLISLIWFFLSVTVVSYIVLALIFPARTLKDFFLAGGNVSPIVNGMATAATWMSAASFVSMAGLVAFRGYDASVFLIGWSGGFLLLGTALAPYIGNTGCNTVPQIIRKRFESPLAGRLSALVIIVIALTYVIGQFRGIGVFFSRFVELPVDAGVYIGLAIILCSLLPGGMRSNTQVQVVQYVLMAVGFVLPAAFISLNLTGTPVPQLGLMSHLADGSGVPMLRKLDQVLTDLGFSAYTVQRGSTLNLVLYTVALIFGTLGMPHILMRFMSVSGTSRIRHSIAWTLAFICVIYTVIPAVGAMARLNLMSTIQVGAVGSSDGNLEYAKAPAWFKNWERTGLLRFEDKNGDGRIQYYNDRNSDFAAKAESFGWKGNEMTKVDNDIMVLANPEIAGLPNWVIALVALGALAAALSTATALLLALSAAISEDLIGGGAGLSERTRVWKARAVLVLVGLVVSYLGLNPPSFAAQVVALSFGLAAAAIFPALVYGIFSFRINAVGAVTGMLSGSLTVLTYVFWYKGWFFIPGTEMMPNRPDSWFLGISPEAFGTIGAMVHFVVAYIVSALSSDTTPSMREFVLSMRYHRATGDIE